MLTLSWSPIGRLTAVSSSLGGSTLYGYDPLDRLATISAGGATTSFLYVGLTDAVARTVTTTGSTTTTTKYVSDLEGTVLFEYDATAREPIFLGRNAHGDVTWSYGSNGAPIGHATYDPFANTVGSATVPAGIRWQGSWEDTTTGLYYVVARWYDPVSGRFVSEDPMEQPVESPQDRAPYAYGAGDSIHRTDPDGRTGIVYDGGRDIGYWVDTSLVREFHEDNAHLKICISGALRIVLAFAGHNRDFMGPDPDGTVYMNWIADRATGVPGLPEMTGLFKEGYGADLTMARYMANWEFADHRRGDWGRLYKSAWPFLEIRAGWTDYSKGVSSVTYYASIEQSILLGVPAEVSVRTASLVDPNLGLPSWRGKKLNQRVCTRNGKPEPRPNVLGGTCNGARSNFHSLYYDKYGNVIDQGHAIAVIGFDASYFYYLDTCWTGTGCRSGPSDSENGGYHYPGSHLRRVWRIARLDLWKLSKELIGGGVLRYSGPLMTGTPH